LERRVSSLEGWGVVVGVAGGEREAETALAKQQRDGVCGDVRDCIFHNCVLAGKMGLDELL